MQNSLINSLVVIFVIGIVTGGGMCLGGIIYVDSTSTGDPNGSFEQPFAKIQDAIDAAAQSGDIVQIRPGVYSGQGNRDLDTKGKAVIIRGIDPADPTPDGHTIIDCDGDATTPHWGFKFHSGEDENCVISGLTIRNADSDNYGGGIICEESSPTIINCIIIGNKARYGGGVGFYYSNSAKMINCTIVGNRSIFGGGGVFVDSYSTVTIENCILWGNVLEDPANNYGPQMRLEHYSSADISYCDIHDGINGVSIAISTVNWLDGNINTDPNFASFSPQTAVETWDLHLQSKFGRWDLAAGQWIIDAITSPCIDAGDPEYDYESESWPHGNRINMGAYGGTKQASMNGNRADFDISGTVNTLDLVELVSEWATTGGQRIIDLDLSGRIDIADMAIFAENWLWQKE